MKKIQAFASAYISLPINITPKVHVVVFHIEEFCDMTGRGLAPWSEQTGESCHHDFNQTWEKFYVRDQESDVYGKRLLQAVQEYNGQHL